MNFRNSKNTNKFIYNLRIKLKKMKRDFIYLICVFGLYIVISTFSELKKNNFDFSSSVGMYLLKTCVIAIILALALSCLFYGVDALLKRFKRKA